jgi:IS30 family transposase
MRCYTQLTQQERYQIYILKKAKHRPSEIARMLKRDKSTISRELRRNAGQKGYRPQQAHQKAIARQQSKIRNYFTNTHWAEVERLLREDWSPEQISLRLDREQEFSISHEWIYQYIYHDQSQDGTLYTHLRCQKKRRKRYGKHDRRGCIPNQVSIEARPSVVEKKGRIGDWEGDTIIGKHHQGAIVSLVERKSCYTLLGISRRKTADQVSDNIIQLLKPIRNKVHTLTFDNGREFAGHETIAARLQAAVYFAHPYASWERGLNENTNGLARQYFPKSSDFTKISPRSIDDVMHRLNHRPRKSLGGKTPYEVFFKKTTSLTVALAT